MSPGIGVTAAISPSARVALNAPQCVWLVGASGMAEVYAATVGVGRQATNHPVGRILVRRPSCRPKGRNGLAEEPREELSRQVRAHPVRARARPVPRVLPVVPRSARRAASTSSGRRTRSSTAESGWRLVSRASSAWPCPRSTAVGATRTSATTSSSPKRPPRPVQRARIRPAQRHHRAVPAARWPPKSRSNAGCPSSAAAS